MREWLIGQFRSHLPLKRSSDRKCRLKVRCLFVMDYCDISSKVVSLKVYCLHSMWPIWVRFGDPDHDRVLRTKTWSCAKMTWSSWPGHTCSSIWEPRFSLGSRSWSTISNGSRWKKNQFWTVIFMKTDACQGWVLGKRYKIYLKPSNNFKRLMVAFLLDVNIWFTGLKCCDVT